MERLTKAKYNRETNTKYVAKDVTSVIESLGAYEDILEKYEISNSRELERLIIVGKAAYARIKLAMGHRVYFVSGKKIKKAHLVGYADNGMSLDQLVIEKKGQTATIPYNHIYISKHEAKRARKGRQLYSLNKKQFALIFGSIPFKKNCYLLEVGRGTDSFVVVQKVFKTYFTTLITEKMNLEEIKSKYNFDIINEYPKERKEYEERVKHLKDKWI